MPGGARTSLIYPKAAQLPHTQGMPILPVAGLSRVNGLDLGGAFVEITHCAHGGLIEHSLSNRLDSSTLSLRGGDLSGSAPNMAPDDWCLREVPA